MPVYLFVFAYGWIDVRVACACVFACSVQVIGYELRLKVYVISVAVYVNQYFFPSLQFDRGAHC